MFTPKVTSLVAWGHELSLCLPLDQWSFEPGTSRSKICFTHWATATDYWLIKKIVYVYFLLWYIFAITTLLKVVLNNMWWKNKKWFNKPYKEEMLLKMTITVYLQIEAENSTKRRFNDFITYWFPSNQWTSYNGQLYVLERWGLLELTADIMCFVVVIDCFSSMATKETRREVATQ